MLHRRWTALFILGTLAPIAGCDDLDPCEKADSRLEGCLVLHTMWEGSNLVCASANMCISECVLDADCDELNDGVATQPTKLSVAFRLCVNACVEAQRL